MPHHLNSLVVILFLATAVFVFAKAPACALASATVDFERRRNLWFAITLTAFLAHDFWIYIVVVAVLLLFAVPREPNKLAMFFFLVLAAPTISMAIKGFGPIENFFTIHYIRLLSLVVLLPAFLHLRNQPDIERFGHSLPDKLIAGYLILNFVTMLILGSATETLRHGAFYAFVDIFLPYYVASRSLKDLSKFRDALMGFAVAVLVHSAISAFEFAWRWLLYSSLVPVLNGDWGYGNYLQRGAGIRAVGSIGEPISSGYVVVVATGIYLYLKKSVPNAMAWGFGLALLIAGILVPLSRGPWIGAFAMFLVFIATGPLPGLRLAQAGLLGILILPLLLVSPIGESIIDHLPWIGTIQAENVTYREQLFSLSIGVIMQNPLFGHPNFYQSEEMQQLIQGQGIIDIVNTYVGVALGRGLVGLSLFAGFFVTVAVGIVKGLLSLPDKNDERHLLGRALFATLIAIMIIIATCSSLAVVSLVYWCIAGLGVGYARMLVSAKTAPSMNEKVAMGPGSRPTNSGHGIYVNRRNR